MNDVLIFLMGSMCGASVGLLTMAILVAGSQADDRAGVGDE